VRCVFFQRGYFVCCAFLYYATGENPFAFQLNKNKNCGLVVFHTVRAALKQCRLLVLSRACCCWNLHFFKWCIPFGNDDLGYKNLVLSETVGDKNIKGFENCVEALKMFDILCSIYSVSITAIFNFFPIMRQPWLIDFGYGLWNFLSKLEKCLWFWRLIAHLRLRISP
jgi:hypothetical protein